ncbi:hypothetical protein [Pseudonocardia kunmingensis]|uniref:Uncharacterized protein n=1 Tax=Pseudonocardia kunmingensis TaxID=630975 RepID=A0A543DPQ5_9PSEU|nr:hypothetical protein [Pseudonocardia kunmingensis]TQM11288.1 hypothetical protein FB558_3846 [Pseudonocardia kunmingensis]
MSSLQSLDLRLDVTDATGLGEEASIAATVTLPSRESLPTDRAPIVCFAKPGGGYSRGYYTVDLPGPGSGAQADWHAERGWIFVSVDHLGVGDSSTKHAPETLDYTRLSAAAAGAEQQILDSLAAGTLAEGFPAVPDPVKIGIGQSMGGCMTIVQQGRYESYDGIGVLGYSAVHTTPPVRPGDTEIVPPWVPRDVFPITWADNDALRPEGIVNKGMLARAGLSSDHAAAGAAMRWGFHWDDVPTDVDDTTDFPLRGGNPPPWASTTVPAVVATWCIVPGAVAPEAAAVTVPVLSAFGQRDVGSDPRGELRAYKSANSVDFYLCPRMAHMHNFAGTRELLWQRLDTWAEWVRVAR